MFFIVPLSILTEVRIIYRIAIETIKGVKRTGLMNIVIVSTMAAILSIFGCLFRTSLGIQSFVHQLGSVLEISVYLKDSATPKSVSQEIYNLGSIKKINVITKEQAWTDLKSQMDVPDIKNPLPNTLRVNVGDQKSIDNIVSKIKHLDGVEGVQFAQELARKMAQVGNITNIVTLIVLIFLGGLTLFIISNTIQLVIQARRQEIEIMRMMGVSNWFIKAPYIIQGASYGFLGALISLIPLSILQSYLDQALNFFQVSPYLINSNVVILCLLMMGILVGAGGSLISVRKYLKI